MTNGKLGDDAKDELASEIIAFANTLGGTLIVGIDEDTATKRAKPPLFPIPRCKEAAARLHQAIGDRIEPKLPVFECEGVVTENDGTSGVIIMRTLQSYLAPHRHRQNNHCYVRRNDRAEPMSMLEIQEMTRQKARSAIEAEKSFKHSGERFYSWIASALNISVFFSEAFRRCELEITTFSHRGVARHWGLLGRKPPVCCLAPLAAF